MPKALIFILLIALLLPINLIGKMRIDFEILFTGGVLSAFVVFIIIKINLWGGLFFALTSFSAFIAFDDVNTQTAYFFVLGGMIWYFLCVKYANENAILNSLCVIALINVAFLILQSLDMDPLHNPIQADIAHRFDIKTGLFAHHNEVSAFLAFSFTAFLRRKWSWGLIFIAIGLLLPHSFAGPLAIACGVYFYVSMRSGNTRINFSVLAIVAIVLYLYSVFIDVPGMVGRLSAWKIGLFNFTYIVLIT